ncbi:MAG: NAD-glutamate dehydrogenase [Gammaproteobacteria bacterium]|jgi:glutamate dehydrogenase
MLESVSHKENYHYLIDKVVQRARDKLPSNQHAQVEVFIRQFYAGIAWDDLVGRNVMDLYGAVMSQWSLTRQRLPRQRLIRVQNPEIEEHGWQSTHTIIEIIQDDMPFLVDSVRLALNRHSLTVHLIVHPVMRVDRDKKGNLLKVYDSSQMSEETFNESYLYFEVDRQTDHNTLEQLKDDLNRVLDDVVVCVEDWQPMRNRLRNVIDEIQQNPPPLRPEDLEEDLAFLKWLDQDHFTFIGYREYSLELKNGEHVLRIVPDSGLGILRHSGESSISQSFAQLHPKTKKKVHEQALLVLTKSNSRATIHRPGYLDYVGIKRFDSSGKVVGEWRFLGLYTSSAYIRRATDIPMLRRKVQYVLRQSEFRPHSHSLKVLLNIVETLPRDELFQCTEDELYDMATGILHLQERQRVRLIIRPDSFGRFVSCLVYMPRERFNTAARIRVQEVLVKFFQAQELDFTVRLTESVLARIHFILHLPPGKLPQHDVSELESRVAETIRSWNDVLHNNLIHEFGEEQGNRLFARYRDAFSPSYESDYPAEIAVVDIRKMESLSEDNPLGMALYHPLEASAEIVRFKLFQWRKPVSLSVLLPVLENMGLKVLDERPYRIQANHKPKVWLHDIGMEYGDGKQLDTDQVRQIFQDAFARIWNREVENDGLNALVLRAQLSWREVVILRSCVKYLRQTGFPFSPRYMERALLHHPQITRMLVDLFLIRFNPEQQEQAPKRSESICDSISQSLDDVPTLDEDRILRRLFVLIQAILRTNYFQTGNDGNVKDYLSIKIDPTRIPDMPVPRPQYEIFVYSPHVEGVHLRGGKVARGGIRWSDRLEDFRTEILGLMKAQMVKNAVIVPVGAKGGFVVKTKLRGKDNGAVYDEVVRCYSTFIRGLLDITDNLRNNEIDPPAQIVRYDEDDPYLVVAADKGTATFSDTANAIAREYGFWLDDAFASGGSTGYDHKKMGITARGVWESVKRHFRETGKDIQKEDFTVVGIGGMGGDVFGNGMLLSRHIRLIAAFNHREIFVDPDPDPEASYRERERLFHLPHASWSDYDPSLISQGGGVYSKSSKAITVSPQMQKALDIDAKSLTPNELVSAILKAPVELLWNGGIGTFVKASTESHDDADDRSNDAVRIDAKDLHCMVTGEGGNLGFTYRARIEYAQHGGRINTDFIDNSGGVDCSDHEVNIKILLNKVIIEGWLNEKQRNRLLAEMTDEVARLVLINNYQQSEALSLSQHLAPVMLDEHSRLIRSMERNGLLDRQTWVLPDDEELAARRSAGQGLTRPELAVLLAYSKIDLFQTLLASDVLEESYLVNQLPVYFPKPVAKRFGKHLKHHSLKREIIATFIVNSMVNRMGIGFAFRLHEHTGAFPAEIARVYMVTRKVFALPSLWRDIADLDNQVEASVQLTMLNEIRKLTNRSCLWLLRNRKQPLDIGSTIETFADGVEQLISDMPSLLVEDDKEQLNQIAAECRDQGVPESLSTRIAGLKFLFPVLDIMEVAHHSGRKPQMVARLYNLMGAELELHWLRDQISTLGQEEHWTRLARSTLRDEQYRLQRLLTNEALELVDNDSEPETAMEKWKQANQIMVDRYLQRFAEFKTGNVDLALLSVATNEVRKLIRTTDGAIDE